jgi:hypothetical protein
MLTTIQIEGNVVNAEKYFAQQMDKLVDKSLEMETAHDSFIHRVDDLYHSIEANRFMLKNNIETSNETFLGVYGKMMCIIGVHANNLTKDSSLVIPTI